MQEHRASPLLTGGLGGVHACSKTLLSQVLLRSWHTTSRGSSSFSALSDVDASGASSPATAGGLSCSPCSGVGAARVRRKGCVTCKAAECRVGHSGWRTSQTEGGHGWVLCDDDRAGAEAASIAQQQLRQSGAQRLPTGPTGAKTKTTGPQLQTVLTQQGEICVGGSVSSTPVSAHLHRLRLSARSQLRPFPGACSGAGGCGVPQEASMATLRSARPRVSTTGGVPSFLRAMPARASRDSACTPARAARLRPAGLAQHACRDRPAHDCCAAPLACIGCFSKEPPQRHR